MTTGAAYRTHDANGNLTSDGTKDFEFDYRNNLVNVWQGENLVITFEYDVFDRRTRSTAGATVRRCCFDGLDPIDAFDGSGSPAGTYVYGSETPPGVRPCKFFAPDWADVDEDEDTSETQLFSLHADATGSIMFATAPDGTVVEQYTYGPCGETTVRDGLGNDLSGVSAIGNTAMFLGISRDHTTGVYFAADGVYDPVVGRVIQARGAGALAVDFVVGGNVRQGAPFVGFEQLMGAATMEWWQTLQNAPAGKSEEELKEWGREQWRLDLQTILLQTLTTWEWWEAECRRLAGRGGHGWMLLGRNEDGDLLWIDPESGKVLAKPDEFEPPCICSACRLRRGLQREMGRDILTVAKHPVVKMGFFLLTGHGVSRTLGAIGRVFRAAFAQTASSGERVLNVLSKLPPGRSGAHIRLVRSEAELRRLFARLSAGGKSVTSRTYPGQMVRLPDGTVVGLRSTSTSGGGAIDVFDSAGRLLRKVHVE